MPLTKPLSGKRQLLYEGSPSLASEDWEPALPCLPCCEAVPRPAYQIGPFSILACPGCGTARVDLRLRAAVRLERIYNRIDYFMPEPRRLSPLTRLRKAVYRSAVSLYQHPDAQQRRVDLLTRFVPPEQPIRYLEIGCGPGRLLRVLQNCCPRWALTGIEPSEVAAEECRQSGWRVLTGTVEEVDLAGERFEAICAWNVIEHVDSPREFLAWIAAHLRPGGHLFLHTPNYGGLMRRLWGASWFELKPEYHLYYFTYPGLSRLAEAVGLRRVHPVSIRRLDNLGHQIRFVAQKPAAGSL